MAIYKSTVGGTGKTYELESMVETTGVRINNSYTIPTGATKLKINSVAVNNATFNFFRIYDSQGSTMVEYTTIASIPSEIDLTQYSGARGVRFRATSTAVYGNLTINGLEFI